MELNMGQWYKKSIDRFLVYLIAMFRVEWLKVVEYEKNSVINLRVYRKTLKNEKVFSLWQNYHDIDERRRKFCSPVDGDVLRSVKNCHEM